MLRYLKLHIFWLIMLSAVLSAHGQIFDDFSDGEFLQNPTWTGDTAKFAINSERLQSNSNVLNDIFYISTPSSFIRDAEWEFFTELQFSTSGNNYVDFWLCSNISNLHQQPNGYFVRVGGTPDEISLYRAQGAVNTKIIDGVDGRSQVSSNLNRIWVKVTCDANFRWTLMDDNTGTRQNYFTEGSISDNTIQSSAHLGIRITQSTASFHNRHFFDDIYAGPIRRDTIPPQIIALTAIDSVTVELSFDEPVDSASATNLQNYLINNGIGNPVAIDFLNAYRILRLTLGKMMITPTEYRILVNGIKDFSGNSLSGANAAFTYIKPFPLCLIITELLPDPTPAVGLPSEEFIEIFNPLSIPFSLAGFTLDDEGARAAVLPNQMINPGEFIIICANSVVNEFTNFGRTIGVTNWPSLNNDKDVINLRGPDGSMINRVAYEISWYPDKTKADGGYSLEIINPDYRCETSGRYNWLASDHPSGGTPGAANYVFRRGPDITPPVISSFRILDSMTLEVIFNEPMDAQSIENRALWSVSQALIEQLIVSGEWKNEVKISLFQPLVPDSISPVRVSVIGATDCPGNVAGTLSASELYFPAGIPHFLDILITEIFPIETPSLGLPQYEFVEILNRSHRTLSLRGMQLLDNTGIGNMPDSILKPGEYAILCPPGVAADFAPFGKAVPLNRWPILNNSGELIQLVNGFGEIIHAVEFSPKWFRDGLKANGGWSLEIQNLHYPCEGENNWKASTASIGGTPGSENSVSNSLMIETSYALRQIYPLDSMTLRVRFNVAADPARITDASNWQMEPDIGLPVSIIKGPGFNAEWVANFNQSLTTGTLYHLTLALDSLCLQPMEANDELVSRVALPEQRQNGDLKLNEILFNPRSGGSDFVEIYNSSLRVLDMRGLILANSNDGSSINAFTTLAVDGQLCFPGDYLTFSDEPDNLKLNYRTQSPSMLMKADKPLPSFPDRNGVVILADTLGNWLEHYAYHERDHFALLKDLDGVSLERISLEKESNNSTNWTSAAKGVGFATPTAQNSMSENNRSADAAIISVNPEIFSPDGDGNDDFISIFFNLPAPGMMVNMRILDDAGRHTKWVARNEYATQNGSFIWQGDNDDGKLCKMGIYIIFTEIFDLQGNISAFKNACVLATRF